MRKDYAHFIKLEYYWFARSSTSVAQSGAGVFSYTYGLATNEVGAGSRVVKILFL